MLTYSTSCTGMFLGPSADRLCCHLFYFPTLLQSFAPANHPSVLRTLSGLQATGAQLLQMLAPLLPSALGIPRPVLPRDWLQTTLVAVRPLKHCTTGLLLAVVPPLPRQSKMVGCHAAVARKACAVWQNRTWPGAGSGGSRITDEGLRGHDSVQKIEPQQLLYTLGLNC
jgi:hypothetical protein